jgi:ABC-type bacteriocin/lantibiotic exporter with double-glycine peptidase domain
MENSVNIRDKIYQAFIETFRSDKDSIYYVVFYALLEGVLVLAIPLTSSFVINSLIAHSYVSIVTLGVIISVIFILIIFLRLIQEYIIEKFEQRVFVREAFCVRDKAADIDISGKNGHIDKLMNYFFDITTIQKVFPIFILNGVGLVIQVVLTLMLLLIFDLHLFLGALFLVVINLVLTLVVGKNGIRYALRRSDAKHDAIYFLQKVPYVEASTETSLEEFESKMCEYVDARQQHFRVRLRQLSVSFIIQGLMITGFFILGGYLVINGHMPVGEFVAAEIIVVTLIYAINSFVKQLDYIYDGIEGFYKIEKLSSDLKQDQSSKQ